VLDTKSLLCDLWLLKVGMGDVILLHLFQEGEVSTLGEVAFLVEKGKQTQRFLNNTRDR